MLKPAIERTARCTVRPRADDPRRVQRYQLAALTFFWWSQADGLLYHSRGTTRNISCRGAFIAAESLPPLGALVELDVFLPLAGGRKSGMRLRGRGKVLRFETGASRGFSVAVSFETDVLSAGTFFARATLQ